MKKKILSVILAASLLASLASCSGGGQAASTTAAATTTTTTAAATESVTEAEPESDADAAPEADPGSPEDSEDGDLTGCQRLAKAAMTAPSVSEIMTMQVDDEEMLTSVMGYDLDLFSEYCVITHLMSVHLIEVVVVKPAAGKADDVRKMLEDRKERIKTDVAFYPEQQENAEKTIVSSINGDEYIYMICGNDPPEMEAKLKAAV